MLALQQAMDAHGSLMAAVRDVLEDGAGVDLDALYYPDDEALFDMIGQIGVAHSNIARWFAAMEGKGALARLMADGLPQAERGALPKRAVVGRDGLMLLLNGATVFGPGYLSDLEGKHGPLFEVEFFELEPGGMVEVKTVDGELALRLRPQDARDPRCVHACLMEARESLRQGVELGERMVSESLKTEEPK